MPWSDLTGVQPIQANNCASIYTADNSIYNTDNLDNTITTNDLVIDTITTDNASAIRIPQTTTQCIYNWSSLVNDSENIDKVKGIIEALVDLLLSNDISKRGFMHILSQAIDVTDVIQELVNALCEHILSKRSFTFIINKIFVDQVNNTNINNTNINTKQNSNEKLDNDIWKKIMPDDNNIWSTITFDNKITSDVKQNITSIQSSNANSCCYNNDPITSVTYDDKNINGLNFVTNSGKTIRVNFNK